ncbi:MAG: hypothetical protein QWI36_02250 [Wolbachia endosymbiont of Tyrophagus putrescentiae]|nr:hypothetical protein [Wolbachia endosymbiont of Tyrophagus putrescentiae]
MNDSDIMSISNVLFILVGVGFVLAVGLCLISICKNKTEVHPLSAVGVNRVQPRPFSISA